MTEQYPRPYQMVVEEPDGSLTTQTGIPGKKKAEQRLRALRKKHPERKAWVEPVPIRLWDVVARRRDNQSFVVKRDYAVPEPYVEDVVRWAKVWHTDCFIEVVPSRRQDSDWWEPDVLYPLRWGSEPAVTSVVRGGLPSLGKRR